MIILNAEMATTLKRMHLITLCSSLIKINQFLVSNNLTSKMLIEFWK